MDCDGYNGVAKNYSKFVPIGNQPNFRWEATTYKKSLGMRGALFRIQNLRGAQLLCDARYAADENAAFSHSRNERFRQGSVLSTGPDQPPLPDHQERLPMPITPLDSARYAPSLRQAASTLKAALVVSAAAILSQGQSDLEANAAAALGHLDVFTAQVQALRDDVLQQDATPAPALPEGIAGTDSHLLDLMTGIVDDRSADLRQALHDVVGHPERDALDAFVASAGALGQAMHDITALLTPSAPDHAAPFPYDQFFLESMQDLSQRDWSPT
jgi:hypothetical protein